MLSVCLCEYVAAVSQKIDYFSIVFQGFTWVVSSAKVFDIKFIYYDKFDGSSKKFSMFLGQNILWYILKRFY